MKVVLRQDVAHVGRKGELVEVANGYGINFLIPSGKALKADSPQGQSYLSKVASGEAQKQTATDAVKTDLQELADKKFKFELEANDSDVLFASLNESKLAELLSEQTSKKIAAKNIALSEGAIKNIGTYQASLMHEGNALGQIEIEVAAA